MYKKLALFAVLGVLSGTAQAQTLIDFDTAPGGAAIADQEVVETTYGPVGVFFDVEDCSNGPAKGGDIDDDCEVIAATGSDTASSPNTVTINTAGREPDAADKGNKGTDCDAFSENDGVIRGDFALPVVMASILVARNDDDDPAYLRAYNEAGDLIDEDLLPASGPTSVYTELEVTGNMAFVRFSGIDGDTVCFDDLEFTAVAATIPALNPWGLLVLLLGVAAATAVMVRRHRRA